MVALNQCGTSHIVEYRDNKIFLNAGYKHIRDNIWEKWGVYYIMCD